MTIGNKIAYYRKAMNMTQDTLAQRLEVSNQAVSKWESDQCCPDIQLLPRLADIFGITIDELFGRPAPSGGAKLPWADDGTLRAVLYRGHSLLREAPEAREITLTIEGAVLDVDSAFSVNCGAVAGDVHAGRDVNCEDVGGDVEAGGSVTCDEVSGDAQAGGSITCDDIGGNAQAGGSITCDEVGGSVFAGAQVSYDSVGGNVTASAGPDGKEPGKPEKKSIFRFRF